MVFLKKIYFSINLLQIFNESEDSCKLFSVIRACRLAAVVTLLAMRFVRHDVECMQHEAFCADLWGADLNADLARSSTSQFIVSALRSTYSRRAREHSFEATAD